MLKDKAQIYSKFIVTFIFIDLLLLPNFPFFAMPLSLPIVILMLGLKKIKIITDKEFVVLLALSFLVLTSVLLSFLQTNIHFAGMNVWLENVKRGFQLLTSFLYYFIIKNSSLTAHINLKKIVMIFVFVYVLLGIISYFDIALYFRILEILMIRNLFVSDWFLIQRVELFRYTYIWMDPNNAAYAFQMVVFYILINESMKTHERIYLYLCLIVSIILSMSTGALLSAALFFLLFYLSKINKKTQLQISFRKIFSRAFIFILGFTAFIILFIVFYDQPDSILMYSIDRMITNTDGGRIDKYLFMFNHRIPNFVGEGYTLLRYGNFFRPHSDHLRLLYSYGVFAYFLSIWFLFRHAFYSSKYFFIIPGFVAFSINSLIDEQKILLILLSLIAYVKLTDRKRNMEVQIQKKS